MIKFIYIFWLIFFISALVQAQTFTINHDYNHIKINYDGTCHTIEYLEEIDLSGLDNPVGQPQLPVYMYRIPLDINEKIGSFQVDEIKERKIDGTFNVKIQQPLWCQDFDKNNIVLADTTQTNFPDKIVEFKGIKYFNGHPIAHFAVHPFRYQSDSGHLYFIEQIRFSVTTSSADSKGIIPIKKFQTDNEPLITLAKSNQNEELPFLPMISSDWIIDEEKGIPLSYISAGLVDRYIIITTDGLAASFEPLALWKTRKGVPTVIRTLDWVRSNFPDGIDDADRIRNYIRWSYKNRGTKYIMLGGDTELIPSRIITTYGFTFPSDYYYADLDGNWNADEDGIFGEADDELDGYPETYVSRIPVKTSDEVDRFIMRLFRYEKMIDIENPYFPGDVLYMAANLDREDDGRELIMSKIDPQINDEFRWTLLTENADIGSDPAPALEALSSNFSIIFSENHGLYHTLRPGARGSNLFTYQIGELTNHDPGIWYVASCYTNDIVKRSLSEMYLLAETGGGVAYIANSSYEYPFSGIYLQEEFFKLAFSKNKYHLSEAHYLSRLPYLGYLSWEGPSRIIVYSTIVLGDAEMPIWTEMPKSMLVNQQSSTGEDGYFFTISVKDESDNYFISNALVTLYRGYDIYDLKRTDASGQVRFDLSNYDPGEVSVTVTKHNYIPFENTADIISHSVAKIRLNNVTFTEIEGIENQQCEPGERLYLSLEIKNTGDLGVSDSMHIQFSGEDDLIQLDTMTIELEDSLAPGQSVLLPAIGFNVFDSIATDTTLISNINFISGSKSLGEQFVKYAVHLPNIVPVDPDIVSISIDSGYVSTVFIELENIGVGGAREITGELCSSQNDVQLLDSIFTYGNIESKSTTEKGASFKVNHSMPSDSLILKIKLIDFYGRTWNYSIDFEDPKPPFSISFKPYGPETIELNWLSSPSDDIIGYNIYRKDPSRNDFLLVNKTLISSAGFFTDNSVENGQVYQYLVQAIDSSYNVSAFASDTISAWPAVKSKSNFPVNIGEKAIGADNSGLAVYDFDNDHKQEIVVAGGHGVLKIYDCDGELIRSINNLKGFMNKPAIGNVYGSDGMEIVVSTYEKRTENNYVYIIDPEIGSVIETFELSYHQPSSPVLKDLNYDGYDDIIILSHGNDSPIDPKNSRLNIWQSTGIGWIIFPGWTEQGYLFEGASSLGMPAAADMTGEDVISVFVPTIEGKLYAFKPTKSAEPVWIKSFSGILNVPLSLADIDRDGNLDMAVVSINTDKLYLLNHLGESLSGWESGLTVAASNIWYIGSPAIMVNLDPSDPQLEIVYIGRDSAYIFKHTGEVLNNWPVSVNNGDDFFDDQHNKLSVNACPVIGDLDQDGIYEVIFVTQDGFIHALNSRAAKEIVGFPVNLWNDRIRGQSPLFADIDHNGDLEVLFVDHGNKLHCWDLSAKYPDNYMLFASQPYSNYRHTGELDTIFLKKSTGIKETFGNLPKQYRLEQNYPNPFNPETVISWQLPIDNQVNLSIYNILGQKIVTLVSQHLPAGVHKISWNGKNEKNVSLPSGIYIYQLTVNKSDSKKILFKKQNKMILIR